MAKVTAGAEAAATAGTEAGDGAETEAVAAASCKDLTAGKTFNRAKGRERGREGEREGEGERAAWSALSILAVQIKFCAAQGRQLAVTLSRARAAALAQDDVHYQHSSLN